MTAASIRATDVQTFDQVLALLARSGLPQEGLSDHIATTLVAEEDCQVVGSAALEVYGQAALLRSVAVDSRLRNQGIGRRLIEDALAMASRRQVRRVYLLTETAASYFARLGFRHVDRTDVDPFVMASVEFQSVCPQSAQVMVKTLDNLEQEKVMKGQTVNVDEVRSDVRSYYGARVQSASAGCCGPADASACCSDSSIALYPAYSADELAHVPADAAAVSFGCGNPTAIAALRPGEVVLDLGAGGGIDVFLAARQVGETGYVYGVDMTDEMLELARRNAAKQGVSNVEFRKGHIEELPLPDASVDVIISNCVINLSPDKGQTLREAFRVLKPGGRLAVSDVVIDGDLSDLAVTDEQVRAGLSWAGCLAGALTAGQYQAFLADAGFEQIAVDVRTRYHWEDVAGMVDPDALGLPEETLHALVDRFTSSDISARRPG